MKKIDLPFLQRKALRCPIAAQAIGGRKSGAKIILRQTQGETHVVYRSTHITRVQIPPTGRHGKAITRRANPSKTDRSSRDTNTENNQHRCVSPTSILFRTPHHPHPHVVVPAAGVHAHSHPPSGSELTQGDARWLPPCSPLPRAQLSVTTDRWALPRLLSDRPLLNPPGWWARAGRPWGRRARRGPPLAAAANRFRPWSRLRRPTMPLAPTPR